MKQKCEKYSRAEKKAAFSFLIICWIFIFCSRQVDFPSVREEIYRALILSPGLSRRSRMRARTFREDGEPPATAPAAAAPVVPGSHTYRS